LAAFSDLMRPFPKIESKAVLMQQERVSTWDSSNVLDFGAI
jgi:hypothetical protein